MGSEHQAPIHTVALDGFWLDQTEVTNGEYEGCVAAGLCTAPRYGGGNYEGFTGENQPVILISWYDADAYCSWMGGTLPTEAQWEYAARGPDNLTYPWGEEEPTCDLANYGDDTEDWGGWLGCLGETAEVGSYPAGASWCGGLELAGNVYELTANWEYGYSAEREMNPTGPESGERKIVRGGAWDSPPSFLRVATNKFPYYPEFFAHTVGFRCIVAADEVPESEVMHAAP